MVELYTSCRVFFLLYMIMYLCVVSDSFVSSSYVQVGFHSLNFSSFHLSLPQSKNQNALGRLKKDLGKEKSF